jgi:hypothetical protein
MDIALLKNSQEGILISLYETRQDLRSLKDNIHSELKCMRSKIKTNFHLNLVLTIGVYAMIFAYAVGLL